MLKGRLPAQEHIFDPLRRERGLREGRPVLYPNRVKDSDVRIRSHIQPSLV